MAQTSGKSIGEVLLEVGLIGRDQLDRALAKQKASAGKTSFAEALLELGAVNEADIAVTLSDRLNFPFLSLKGLSVNPEVCGEVPDALVRQFNFVPIDMSKTVLSIAMADPSNEQARSEIEKVTKRKLQVFVSMPSEVRKAISEVYTGKTDTSQ